MDSLQVFIRHPDEIPLELSSFDSYDETRSESRQLGLICNSPHRFENGSSIRIAFPFIDKSESSDLIGVVNSCRKINSDYELAIAFPNQDSAMRMRMLEQRARIYLYQQKMAQLYDRHLSEQDAALEWIDRYAANFPTDDV
ncbi:hypothetical protein [Marinobacterium arenosum]|uniref:hypothetical protein n=1 Tax=Marinobacterium arenosum TaxID=2862496 RepID=UPI001C98DA6A|nr:hypothetical protein [Marinobacterium arenosum]MBY4676655.1 hypothetical protein [Marinobacterium arenosum]